MRPINHKKEKQYEDKYYDSRRAAFRAAKRDCGVPVSQQPVEVLAPNDEDWEEYELDSNKNRRLFRFFIFIIDLITGFFIKKEIHIREDKDYSYGEVDGKGDQDDHFNSGEEGAKLKRHHYFKKKSKNDKNS